MIEIIRLKIDLNNSKVVVNDLSKIVAIVDDFDMYDFDSHDSYE